MNSRDMIDCEYLPLTEVLSFIVDNRGKSVPTTDDGIPLIATNCIKNTELYPVFEKVRFLSKDTYKNWFRAHPKPGDIIFVNKGTPGRVCLVPDPVNFCIAQDMMAFRVDKNVIDNKFLFAVLRSPQFQNQIENFHVGTLIPHFKKGDLDKLMIPIPTMKVQKYIGDTYFALCNKIELNNLMNKNLEEMAQAIFKSWFINFEPFQEGEFEESDLGMIPKGWRTGILSDLIVVKYGKDHKKLNDGTIPVYGSGGVMRHVDQFIYSEESVLIPRKGTLSNIIYLDDPFWSVDTMFYSEMKMNCVAKYVYFLILSKNISSMNVGSAVPSMTTEILNNLKVLLPPNTVLERFDLLISDIFRMKKSYVKENQSLSQIRDTLLPKLMSGEVRIPYEEVI